LSLEGKPIIFLKTNVIFAHHVNLKISKMSVNNSIGKRIEVLRSQKEISMEDLAERCGFSVEMMAKLEEGQFIPSLGHLIKVARVLGVRLGTFLDDDNNLGPVITRKENLSKGLSFSSKNSSVNGNLDFFPLANDKASRAMEPFIVDIHPLENKEFSLSSHEGEEFLFVLNGNVEISYGKDIYYLSQGDSIYYDSLIEHNVHAADQNPAQLLGVVYAPI
jgi:transcriptional regulator with XRE-family HTH domain